MAAPVFSAITTAAGSSTVAKPANTGGILVLAGCTYDDATVAQGEATPPSGGWTLRSFSTQGTTDRFVSGWMWTKVAEAGDPANFVWTETTAGTYHESVCIRYTHGSGDPIVDDTATGTAGRATSGNIPALTTTVDECVIVAVKFGYDSAGIATPSPYTQRANWDGVCLAWDRAAATIGTYGPTAATWTSTDGYSIHAVAISPPAAAAAAGPQPPRRRPALTFR